MDASDSYVAVAFSNTSILVFDITDGGTLIHDIRANDWPSISSIEELTVQLSDSYLVARGKATGSTQDSTLVFSI